MEGNGMNELTYQELLEISWRRKLTLAEESRLQTLLAAHPEAQNRWSEEAAVNDLLHQMPAAPLASNFTARVLQAVDAEEARNERSKPREISWHGWIKRFLPQAAGLSLLLVLGVTGLNQYRAYTRTQVAKSAAIISDLASLPGPEIFRDFEAIQQLRQASAFTDDALLAALQ